MLELGQRKAFLWEGLLYSPRSVVQSMLMQKFNNYWNRTETFEALRVYIDMNYDGLRDAILTVMAGGRLFSMKKNFLIVLKEN